MIARCNPVLVASLRTKNTIDSVTLKLRTERSCEYHIFPTRPQSIFTSLNLLSKSSDTSLFVNKFKPNICLSARYSSLDSPSSKIFFSKMTNKPRNVLQQSTNQSNACLKSHLTSLPPKSNLGPETQSYHLAQSPTFRTMAGIQKLATEPTREHIENIRHFLRRMNAKNNDNQQITLEKDYGTGIATVCIRSAAKNGISGRMMCDMLDIIDELNSWNEGKGVIIYGHKGFFCSGKYL